MSVGIVPAKGNIDAISGQLVNDLEYVFSRIEKMQTWLLATPDATLTAAPYSYTSGEVAQLKSAYADLMQLITIYRGSTNLSVAKDFRTFAKLLAGIGV